MWLGSCGERVLVGAQAIARARAQMLWGLRPCPDEFVPVKDKRKGRGKGAQSEYARAACVRELLIPFLKAEMSIMFDCRQPCPSILFINLSVQR